MTMSELNGVENKNLTINILKQLIKQIKSQNQIKKQKKNLRRLKNEKKLLIKRDL